MSKPPSQLAPKYAPAEVEPLINARWREAKAFAADPNAAGSPYCIVIPPPNVTAALHMGHALNNTLQDILIRWRRMVGDNTLWMPGTDHAGIATQTVVDRRLKLEGKPSLIDYKKMEVAGEPGREKFIEKVSAWKDEYEAQITHQLVEMGCSCDWDRQRFTMDPVCAAAVREAFFRLFKDGLIYRGKRLVNWDPVTQTALADDEVENKEVDGHFYYMRYPLMGPPLSNGQNYVTVATTRPETMLGDTAVAVNPKDPRAEELRGRIVLLPIVNRQIPVIEDDYVVLPVEYGGDEKDTKAQMATGFLKVTPAHDPNDWLIGTRHDLPVINIMAPDGSISKDHGWPEEEWDAQINPTNDASFLLGKSRDEARKLVVDFFKDHKLLEEIKPHRHSVGHSYRSHAPIEPYLSDQWYVKVADERLAGVALAALSEDQRADSNGCVWKDGGSFDSSGGEDASWQGELRFYPPRYAKTFQTWHENIRDWCISRQLWWGHRIPVWSLPKTGFSKNPDLLSQFEAQLSQWETENRVARFFRSTDPEDRDYRGLFICVRDDSDSTVIGEIESWGYERDPDVLDTWFSSALWPYSTMGWPDPSKFPDQFPAGAAALNKWNPGNVLCTAREIITLWVSRMVMTNLYLRGCLPFTEVFIHAMIQDGHGQKMSKSLGNGVDPLDIIHSHGADAMRFTLALMTTQTQDVRLPVEPVCPHCQLEYAPKNITTAEGHVVMAPTQVCPHCKKSMCTSYGVASGIAKPTEEAPAARNTSPKFDSGRNFTNKLWNAVRFAMGNLDQGEAKADEQPQVDSPATDRLSLADRWILSRLASTVRDTNKSLGQYEFNRYGQGLYDFIWRDFCDWYIEAVKPTVKSNAAQQRVLATVIDSILRLLHPIMPFVTEKLWEHLNEIAPQRGVEGIETPASDLLIKAAWPKADEALIDSTCEKQFELVQRVVGAIRELRTSHKVPPRQNVTVTIKVPADQAKGIAEHIALVGTLSNSTFESAASIGPNVQAPEDAAKSTDGDLEIHVHGVVDSEAEESRMQKRKTELEKSKKALEGRLNNKGYTDKAPAHLVQETRDKLDEVKRELEAIG